MIRHGADAPRKEAHFLGKCSSIPSQEAIGKTFFEHKENQMYWDCNVCGATNYDRDFECQFCECGGAECERDNCSKCLPPEDEYDPTAGTWGPTTLKEPK